MGKIIITMPYYDRQIQLNKTLETIAQTKHRDFSVIIVDDCSPSDIVLPNVPFDIEVIKIREKTWTNCAPVHNMAFNRALRHNPDAVIIQSPECYHVGDVLSYVNTYLTDENYLAFACFQIDKATTFAKHDIMALSDTSAIVTANPKGLGQNGWWNHSVHFYHPQYWCAAIKARNLVEINGIDERFAHGYAIEDGWFIDQVERYGLNIEIVDYPFVVHQWHDRIMPKDTVKLVEKNKALWASLKETQEHKSIHTITPNLSWSGI